MYKRQLIDAVWGNCILPNEQTLELIDQEWRYCSHVPLAVILLRSIDLLVQEARTQEVDHYLTQRSIQDVQAVFSDTLKIEILPAHEAQHVEVLAGLFHFAYGVDKERVRSRASLQKRAGRAWAMYENSADARAQLSKQVERTRRKVKLEVARLRDR